MNKYIALLMSWILLAGLLSGCLPSSDPNLSTKPTTTVPTIPPTQTQITTTAPTQPATVPTQPEDPGIELESRILCQLTCDAAAKNVEWPILIKSVAELQEFANSDFGKNLDKISEVTPLYDDAFFVENTLILTCIFKAWDPHGYHGVDSAIKKDGGYLFSIGLGSTSMGYGVNVYDILFVEVKDDIPKDAVINFELADYLNAVLVNDKHSST